MNKAIGFTLAALLIVLPGTSGAYVGASLTGDVDAGLNVTATNVEADASSHVEVKTTSTEDNSMTAARVKTAADLSLFTKSVEEGDENVKEVHIKEEADSDTRVIVKYAHKGRLLGFIPIRIVSTTEVREDDESDIRVRSRLPWWSFLVAGKNYAKADIENRLETKLKARFNADLSAAQKAEIAEEVALELKAHATTMASLSR